jgi:3-dehydroquinate synthase
MAATGNGQTDGWREVWVDLPGRDYAVVVGSGVLGEVGQRLIAALGRRDVACARRVGIVFDQGLSGELVERVRRSVEAAGLRVSLVGIAATEQGKSLETVGAIVSAFADAKLDRGDVVVALGGGIVGDLAGFAAAVYKRGVGFVQCPTTLLAMVDASVGGKTGANLRRADGGLVKNAVGSFHQPLLVLADVDVLRTLSNRAFACGLAECVKHAMIAGKLVESGHCAVGIDEARGLLDGLTADAGNLLGRDPKALIDLVWANVALKAAVVCADERETASDEVGGRALLNLGHTFGHVIEGTAGASAELQSPPLQHGECVGLGLLAACATGEALGTCDPALRMKVGALLRVLGLPTSVRGLGATDQLITAMRDDKKVQAGALRIIVPVQPIGSPMLAQAVVMRSPDERAVAAGWDAIRAG